MSASASRIPSLDGLRAVSIACVLIGHVSRTLGLSDVLDLGNLGVRVFFVISGFLITGLLLDERQQHGSISLGRFYLRRAFRIFPAFYVFLAFIVVKNALAPDSVGVTSTCIMQAAAYISNYGSCSWDLGHTWSLSVEEQFYLLWPAALALGGMRAAVATVILAPLARYWLNSAGLDITYRFECVADALAIGALIAGFGLTRRAAGVHWGWLIVASGTALALHLVGPHPSLYGGRADLYGVLAPAFLNPLIAFCLAWCVANPTTAVARVLNSRSLSTVGAMSYSIYLWQQPFLNAWRISANGSALWRYPLNLVAIAVLSGVSFYLVEKPMLRLRDRILAQVASRRRAPKSVPA